MNFYIYSFTFYLSIVTCYPQAKVAKLSHYLLPEFTEGIVQMKSGIENTYLLNYNMLTEEMIFKDQGKALAIGYTEMLLIDTVFIRERKFFLLNDKFVELIYHSKCDLYAENNCKVKYPGKPVAYDGTSQTSAVSSIGSFKSGSVVYDLKLPEDFEVKPYTHYWLLKNGILNKFVNIRQLMKLYDSEKHLFNTYVKMNDVKYENQESIIRLINDMEIH